MRVFRGLLLILLTIGSSGIITEVALARRGGGFSSSRSYGSRSSASSRSRTWKSHRSSASTLRNWQKKPQRSAADQKLQSQAAKNGTSFATKASATTSFTNKYKPQYTQTLSPGSPAPASRPNYIPATTNVSGKTHIINYNVDHGGYGYWSGGRGIGTWMMYDAMSDAAMTSALMQRHHYYYDTPRSRARVFTAFMPVIGLLIVVVIVLLSYRAYA